MSPPTNNWGEIRNKHSFYVEIVVTSQQGTKSIKTYSTVRDIV
jgi:hypothetical protein